MPNRYETMHAIEEYLRTEEEARMPQPIWSAQAVGICCILLGAVMTGLSLLEAGEISLLLRIGVMLIPIGAALLLLGVKGVAKYRVTRITRYPQQTGEMADMFFQILGENYLWIVVASMILLISFLAFGMR